jgi:hypothetical protein
LPIYASQIISVPSDGVSVQNVNKIPPQNQQQYPNHNHNGNIVNQWTKYPNQSSSKSGESSSGWIMYPQVQNQSQQFVSKRKQPLFISSSKNPLDILSTDVTAILNKITPQTFEKLSQQMLTLNITNTDMLDHLIKLIFEKALQEPNFTDLYAELCHFLNKEASHWEFYIIVKNIEIDPPHYFWIKDFSFENHAAGPFYSVNDCINAVMENPLTPPLMKNINNEKFNSNVEIILFKDILFKVLIVVFKYNLLSIFFFKDSIQ